LFVEYGVLVSTSSYYHMYINYTFSALATCQSCVVKMSYHQTSWLSNHPVMQIVCVPWVSVVNIVKS